MKSTAVLALTAAVMLLAGCGGDDEEDTEAFEKGARAATAETSRIGQGIATAIGGARTSTNRQLARTFSGLSARTRATVDKLGALDPPDSARNEVDELESTLDTGAKDLAAISTAARENDAAAARTATEKLLRDSPAIKKANAALKAEVAEIKQK